MALRYISGIYNGGLYVCQVCREAVRMGVYLGTRVTQMGLFRRSGYRRIGRLLPPVLKTQLALITGELCP